jgi:ADP-ribosylglycohydrolase
MPGDPRLPIPLDARQWTDDTQMTLCRRDHVERGQEIRALALELWRLVEGSGEARKE